MLVTTLDWSDFVGRIAIGRVVAGKIRKGQRIALLKHIKIRRRCDNGAIELFDLAIETTAQLLSAVRNPHIAGGEVNVGNREPVVQSRKRDGATCDQRDRERARQRSTPARNQAERH